MCAVHHQVAIFGITGMAPVEDEIGMYCSFGNSLL